MYEQLFLMYVIPSVMVQSYICYVTKPIVEVELSKFSDLSLILSANVWGRQRKGHKGKVKVLTVQKQLMKDGISDPEAEARSRPTRHLETWIIQNPQGRESSIPSGRVCQLQNCSSYLLTTNSRVSPVTPCHRFRFLYCFMY